MLGLVYKGTVYSASIYTAKADLFNSLMVINVYFAKVTYYSE